MQKEKIKSKEEIAWLVANEYYEHLVKKKEGKALRKHCFDMTNKFMECIAKLRGHE